MTFAATLVDEKNRGVFLTPLDEAVKEQSDFFIGLYEVESDTACGVMAVATVSDDSDKTFALSVREVIIEDAYNNEDALKALLTLLKDVARIAKCSAVFYSEYVAEEQEEETEKFFADLGFFEEEKKLSLYKISFGDVKANDPVTKMGCLHLNDLSEDQWIYFAREASGYSFEILDRTCYDPKTSTFLVDDDGVVQGGMLTSIRNGSLFIEGVAAYGSDEGGLINDLIFWGKSAAKKSLSKDSPIYMYMFSGRVYSRMLKDFSSENAKKVGSLVSFCFETEVF